MSKSAPPALEAVLLGIFLFFFVCVEMMSVGGEQRRGQDGDKNGSATPWLRDGQYLQKQIELAQDGDHQAQTRLGIAYSDGKSVDLNRAYMWCLLSLDKSTSKPGS
jgi:hypothetical protein